MNAITQPARSQAGKLATGADIRTARPGARLRFGGGLYLLVSPAAKSWQVHYHVAGKHQAVIVGRWPELGVTEAKAKREAIRQTIRAGGDPAHDRHEQRQARKGAEAATVRAVGERWIAAASVARGWSAPYVAHTRLRLTNHIFKTLGDRPIGRVTTGEIEALVLGLAKEKRAQATMVRQNLLSLFDYATRHKLAAENPVRVIGPDLPKRIVGDEQPRAHVETVAEARAVLAAFEATAASVYAKLAHRLVALTAVRKLEGIGAQWAELAEAPDGGMTWTIPGARMKGRRGKKRDHVVPLAPQAADIFRASRELQALTGARSEFVFPGHGNRGTLERSGLNDIMGRALAGGPLAGRHTVHGWRSTFYTVMKEADYRDEAAIDAMLAHRPLRPSSAAIHYDSSRLIRAGAHLQPLIDRRRIATAWADQLLAEAPTAAALAGLAERPDAGNVVQLREAA